MSYCAMGDWREKLAIKVTDVHLSYDDVPILKGTNMLIPKGTVYALLGASGCGKTTLIKCILGLLKQEKGSISIFGDENTGKKIQIGYMPQEDGLDLSITAEETLIYFARITQVKHNLIKSQIIEICELLQMKNEKSKLVSSLSGGEKRRLSLGVSLVSSPAILILDEPTVGIDVKLRRKIWRHLISLTRENHTTVLLTTHYIAEAKDANTVAFMRAGEIICESSPALLFEKFGVSCLEKSFLKLAKLKDPVMNKTMKKVIVNEESQNHESIERCKNQTFSLKAFSPLTLNPNRVIAHITKHWITDMHNPNQFIIKTLTLLFMAIVASTILGHQVRDISVGVYNSDNDSLSISIIDSIDGEFLKVSYVASESELKVYLDSGDNWAAIYFPPKYSQNVSDYYRKAYQYRSNDPNLKPDKFDVYSDISSFLIRKQIEFELFKAINKTKWSFRNVQKSLFLEVTDKPYDTVFLGDGIERHLKDTSAIDSMINFFFFFNIIISAVQFQVELKHGFLERCLTSGLTIPEIVTAYVITSLPQTLLQIAFFDTIYVAVFNVPINNTWFVVLLQMLMVVTGVLFGLVLSSLATSEMMCVVVLLAVFTDVQVLSGYGISTKTFPFILKCISKLIPPSHAMWSIKYLLLKFWPVTKFYVLMGALVPLIFTVACYYLACISIERKFYQL